MMTAPLFLAATGGAVALGAAFKAKIRLDLSRAKYPSLTGHARMARRIAGLVPFYEYDDSLFFRADQAPENVAAARREGFNRLSAIFAERFRETADLTDDIVGGVSDLQFTSRYRVPFQFSRFVRKHFKTGTLLASSAGPTVTDLDGNRFYDLTGSYGTNLFGYDFYKECIRRGSERVQDLGPGTPHFGGFGQLAHAIQESAHRRFGRDAPALGPANAVGDHRHHIAARHLQFRAEHRPGEILIVRPPARAGEKSHPGPRTENISTHRSGRDSIAPW